MRISCQLVTNIACVSKVDLRIWLNPEPALSLGCFSSPFDPAPWYPVGDWPGSGTIKTVIRKTFALANILVHKLAIYQLSYHWRKLANKLNSNRRNPTLDFWISCPNTTVATGVHFPSQKPQSQTGDLRVPNKFCICSPFNLRGNT